MSNAIRDYFTRRSPASGRVILGVWLASYLSASTPALGLPRDGQVTHGQGSIEATSARTMEIRQASERMAASFSSFDISSQEAVNVDQPGASSVFLGNISGESATTIFGTLTANGSVMLVNPRGVVFGKGSRVDTASLIASSLGVDVDEFVSGALELEFSADMAGRIVNRGIIQAAKGGSVTLMGDEVLNDGLIVAEMGRVDLASGSEAVLTFDQDRLIGLKITKSALGDLGGDTAVLNGGAIEAAGGQIFLSADAARDLFSRAVQNEGILRANRAEEVDGEIVLSSTGDTWNSGRIQATADSGTGGSVQVLGDRVGVSGEIDASGANGGGEIRVGGDFQGKGETQTAKKTYVGPEAELKADATEEGDGGRVIVWADDATQFFGSLSARGGEHGGDGGFAEVSGKGSLNFTGSADLSAAEEASGTLLLDPQNIRIVDGGAETDLAGTVDDDGDPDTYAFAEDPASDSELDADVVTNILDGGTTVTLQAHDDITIDELIDASGATTAGGGLTLEAGDDILVNQGIRLNAGALSLTAGAAGATPVAPDGTADIFLAAGITLDGFTTVNASAEGALDFLSDISADGAVALTGATGIAMAADVTTTGDNITFNSALTLSGAVALDTGAGDSNTTFASTVDGANALQITGDAGAVTFTGAVGGNTALTSLNVVSSGQADLAAVTTTGNLAITGTNIDINGTDTTLQTTGGGSLTLTGAVDLDGSGTTTLDTAGTTDGNVMVTGALAGAGSDDDLAVTAGTGTVGFQSAVSELLSLNVMAASQVDVTDVTTSTGNLTITGTNIDINGTDTTLQTTGGGSLTLDGAVDLDGSGTMTLDTEDATDGNILVTGTLTGTGGDDDLVAVADSGTIMFQSDLVNLRSLNIPSSSQVDMLSASTATGDLAITATNIDLNGNGSTLQTTDGGNLTLTGDVDLDGTGNHALDTDGTADGNLIVGGTVTGTGGDDTLSLTSGTGGTTSVSAFTGLDTLSQIEAASLTVTNASDAATVDLTGSTGGLYSFDGSLTAIDLNANAGTYDLALNGGATITSKYIPENTGTLSVDGVTFLNGTDFTAVTTSLEGDMTVSGDTIFGDVVVGSETTVDGGANALTFNGAVDDDANGGTASGMTILSDGSVTFGAGGAVGANVAIDSFTTNGTGPVNFGGGTLNVAGNTTTFNNPLVLTADMTVIDAGGTESTPLIAFNDTVDSDTGTNFQLTVDAINGGTIGFNGVVGGNRPLSSLIISQSHAVTLAQNVTLANQFEITDSAGTVNFQNVLTAASVLGHAGTGGYAFDFDAAPAISGSGTFASTGGVNFDAGGSFGGGLTVSAGTTTLTGTLSTTNSAIELQDVILDGVAVLEPGSGTVTGGSIDDDGAGATASDLTITSDGLVDLGGAVGGIKPVDSLTVSDAGGGTALLRIDATTIDAVGGTLTFNTPVTLLSDTTLTDTGGTGITFNSTVDGGFLLSVESPTAPIAFNDAVGTGMALDRLTVMNSMGTTFASTVNVTNAAQLTDTTGTINFQDVLTAGSVTALAGAGGFAVEFDANATASGAGSFANAGGVTFASGGTFDGGLTVSGGTTTVTGTLATDNNAISLGPVTLTGKTTADSNGGDITTGDVTGGGNVLVLDGAATGAIAVNSFSGGGDLTVTDSDSATFGGAVTAGTIMLTDATNTVAFKGDTTINAGLITASQGYNVSFTGSTNTVAGDTTFVSTGVVTLGDAATDSIEFTGGLDTRSASGTTTGGAVSTVDAAMDLSDLTLVTDTTLTSGSGAITGGAATDGASSFTLTVQDNTAASTGAATFNGAVTLDTLQTFAQAYEVRLLGGGTIDTDTTFANTTTVALGDQDADSITFTGGLDTTAATSTRLGGTVATTDTQMDLGASTLDANTTLVTGAGAINLASATDGTNNFELSLQDAAATGAVTIAGSLTVNELAAFAGAYDVNLLGGGRLAADANFLNTGALVIGDAAADTFDFDGGLDTTGGPSTLSLAGTVRTDSRPMDLIAATITDNTVLSSGSGAISAASVTDAGNDLTLTLQEDVAASTGTLFFSGAVTVEDLITFGRDYSVELVGNGTIIDQAVEFLNTGTLTLGNGGDALIFSGGLATAGNATNPSSTTLNSDVATAGGTDITLGAVTLAGNSSLGAAGAGGLTTDAISAGTFDLSLDGDTGAVNVDSFADAGAVTLVDASGATLANASDAISVDLNGSQNGTYAFNGALTTDTLVTNAANDGNNAFTLDLKGGLSITKAVTFDNSDELEIGAAGVTTTFNGGFDTTAVGGLVTLAGNIVSPAGMTLNDLTLIEDTTLDSDGAALTVVTVTSGGFALGLDGGAAGTVTVGALSGTGDLTVMDSDSATFTGAVDADTITLSDTSTTIAFQGNTSAAAGLTTAGNPYSVSFTGTTNAIAGSTSFLNGGTVTLGDGVDAIEFTGGVSATTPAQLNLGGTLTAAGSGVITLGDDDTAVNVTSNSQVGGTSTGAITFGDISLADGTSLTAGTGIGNEITTRGVVGTAGGGGETMVFDTTGTVSVDGVVGAADGANNLDQLTITQSGGTTFASTVDAETVTLTDTAGTVAFQGDTSIGTTMDTAAQGYSVSLTSASNVIAGTTAFLNTGSVILGDQLSDQTTFVNGVSTRGNASGPTETRLAGRVLTDLGAGQGIDLGGSGADGVVLTANSTLIAGAGSINLGRVTDQTNGFSLSVQDAASTGVVSIGELQLGALNAAAGAFDLALQSGGTVANSTTLQNTGTNQLGDEATDAFDFNGGLVATAGTSNLFGSFDTSNTDATLGVTTLAGTTSIDTGVGDLTLGATTGNGNDWTLTANALTLGSLAGGGAVRLVDIVSSEVTNDFGAASLEIARVDTATFGGNLSTTGALGLQDLGTLDLAGDAAAGSLRSNAGGSTLNFGGATSVGGALALNDGSAATFSGALAAGSFTSGATGMSISLNGAVDVAGATSLQNTGGLVLGDDGDVQIFAGGLTATDSDVSLSANVRTRGAVMELAAVNQSGAGSIDTTTGGNGGGAAITLGAVDAGGFALSLTGGSGGEVVVDAIADAGTANFVSADGVRVDGGLQATTALVGSAGSFRVGGALDLGALDTSGAGNASVTLTGGGVVDSDTTFANTGGVSLGDGDGDRFVFGGGFDTTAGDTTLNADVATDSGRLDVGALTVAGDSTLDATNDGDPGTEGAAVELAGAVTGSNGSESLNIRGGTGAVTATAGVSGIGSFFVRSGSDLTLGEISTNGNSIRGIVSGEVALQGNLTDVTGDISIVTTAGTLQQADDTRILAQQGNVHLAASNRIRVFNVHSEQGSILLSLLDPSTNPDTPRVIQRGRASGDFATDLTAPNGVVAVISGGKSDFGTTANGFRIEANQQFVNLNTGSSFIDQSNAAPLTVLPSAQASQFQQVFEQNTPARLVELEIEAAVLASLSAAITNPSNTVESASQATTIESQALTQQSEEEESLSNLSEDVFIDITLVNAEQQPLCLPESLQGFDSVGCDGQEAVALWMERLGLQLVAATRGGEEPVLARMPLPRPGGELFGTAGGGH